jgi:hypothetical protein
MRAGVAHQLTSLKVRLGEQENSFTYFFIDSNGWLD